MLAIVFVQFKFKLGKRPNSIYLVHLDLGHLVVAGRDHTGYPHVHVDHDRHRNEEWAHRRKDDVALVLVVPALVQLAATGLVPAWRKKSGTRVILADFFVMERDEKNNTKWDYADLCGNCR